MLGGLISAEPAPSATLDVTPVIGELPALLLPVQSRVFCRIPAGMPGAHGQYASPLQGLADIKGEL